MCSEAGIESWPFQLPCRLHTLTAEMIMATGVVGFRTVESVANVLAALQNSTHNGFPIGISDGNSRPAHMRGVSYSNLVSLAQLAMDAGAGTSSGAIPSSHLLLCESLSAAWCTGLDQGTGALSARAAA